MQDRPYSPLPNSYSLTFLILLFILSSVSLYSQTEEFQQLNYYISHDENDEVQFVQRLTWQHSDYVLRYIAVIEQFIQNDFIEIERIETDKNFVEVTLGVGNYRYRIEVYDLFDALYHTSSWLEFEIIRAYQPEISGFSPNAFYLDEDDTWAVTLRGRNLLPNAEYYLVSGNTRLTPESFLGEGNSARLTFSEVSLIPGQYDIYVKNPGGLDILEGTFTIGYRKPLDFNIALMYSPIIPIFGYHFKGTEPQAPFTDFIYPLSGGIRASLIPFKRPWGYLGAEITASYSYLANEEEFYSASGNFVNAHISFLYQRYFGKKAFSLNAGLGAGVTMLMQTVYDYPIGKPSDTYTGLYPSLIGSLSFSIFVIKPLYITFGADYINVFVASEDGNMLGITRPFIGVGLHL